MSTKRHYAYFRDRKFNKEKVKEKMYQFRHCSDAPEFPTLGGVTVMIETANCRN